MLPHPRPLQGAHFRGLTNGAPRNDLRPWPRGSRSGAQLAADPCYKSAAATWCARLAPRADLGPGRGQGLQGARRRDPRGHVMIDPGYVQRMARYNRWQNENAYAVADGLTPLERQRIAAPSSAPFTRP